MSVKWNICEELICSEEWGWGMRVARGGYGPRVMWVWFMWNDRVHMGATNSVKITQNWAGVGQSLSQGVMGCNRRPIWCCCVYLHLRHILVARMTWQLIFDNEFYPTIHVIHDGCTFGVTLSNCLYWKLAPVKNRLSNPTKVQNGWDWYRNDIGTGYFCKALKELSWKNKGSQGCVFNKEDRHQNKT